jgi:UDP:flavonoid glycosyltransferase YjiC (YdhE family)
MIKNLPKNVKISNWLPQNGLLAHPSLKLFITHAGLLSTHEATWHGVPMVGILLFTDQFRNLNQSVSAEVAIKVDFQTLSTQKLKTAIDEVL